jgi:hypothetical protein
MSFMKEVLFKSTRAGRSCSGLHPNQFRPRLLVDAAGAPTVQYGSRGTLCDIIAARNPFEAFHDCAASAG